MLPAKADLLEPPGHDYSMGNLADSSLALADFMPYPGYQKPHRHVVHELTGHSFVSIYSAVIALNFLINTGVLAGAYAVYVCHEDKKPGQLWYHAAWVTFGGWLLDGFGLMLYRTRWSSWFKIGLPDLVSYGILMAVLLFVFNLVLARRGYRLSGSASWRMAAALAAITNPFYVVGLLEARGLTSFLWS